MVMSTPAGNKMVMDLEKMGQLNAEGCPACGVWDDKNKQYVEKQCYQADRATGAR